MPSRTTELLLEDIIHASDKILMYTRGMSYYDFSADDKTVDAVVRNIEIISEAANKIPEQYKTAHPEIDWGSVINYKIFVSNYFYKLFANSANFRIED